MEQIVPGILLANNEHEIREFHFQITHEQTKCPLLVTNEKGNLFCANIC